ncbi:hypothetical protein ACN9MI_20195 [Rhodococcoides fascians]|uniref:ATP dependent DNA ligase n=1 Tax=Rhodococcoides fascians TaxID=1828 RepID=UPI003CF0290F
MGHWRRCSSERTTRRASWSTSARVGTGFTDRIRRELRSTLTERTRPDSALHGPIPRTDAVGVSWVTPELVATVEYREQSTTGRLRHPAFKGIRSDMAPRDVVT